MCEKPECCLSLQEWRTGQRIIVCGKLSERRTQGVQQIDGTDKESDTDQRAIEEFEKKSSYEVSVWQELEAQIEVLQEKCGKTVTPASRYKRPFKARCVVPEDVGNVAEQETKRQIIVEVATTDAAGGKVTRACRANLTSFRD